MEGSLLFFCDTNFHQQITISFGLVEPKCQSVKVEDTFLSLKSFFT